MELFSEIYGCYYNTVAKVLEQAPGTGAGLTRGELEQIVRENAFSESVLHLLPRLLSGEWRLLRERHGRYRSRLAHADTSLPLTALQKAWVRALLDDRRIRLFLEPGELMALRGQYRDVQPLYRQEDFLVFDAATDGDDFGDREYIARFRTALHALRAGRMLEVLYLPPNDAPLTLHVRPRHMLYSAKDDKFRLECQESTANGRRRLLLNMAWVQSLKAGAPAEVLCGDSPAEDGRTRVSVAISAERNALERCMLQFAAYEKFTGWDEARGQHICEIACDPMEEAELLIRLLSFGPVIEVLGPERFRREIERRVRQQIERVR